MHAALTVRRLRPGSYDAFRKAWEPDVWPEGFTKAYILRNLADPDEVIAFGFFEGDITKMRDDPALAEQQQVRLARIAPHVASTGADGLYEVIEEVRRPE